MKIIFALLFAALIAHAEPPVTEAITITSIEQLTDNNIKITWKGLYPPYKLQTCDDVKGNWRDASYHLYGNSVIVKNALPLAYYRVRSIPDRTPPEAIRGFGARQITCEKVQLTWDASYCVTALCADNVGGTGLRGYRIYRDEEFLVEVPFPMVETVDVTVKDNRTYQYWATAVDVAGNESPRTGTRTVVVPPCDPGANLINLAWDASESPEVVGYYVYYGYSTHDYIEKIDVGNNLSATISGLRSQFTYYFTVVAYNADGLESEPTEEVIYWFPLF